MFETKTIDTLVEQMILKVLHPNVLTLKPYDRVHVCKDETDNEFSFNILSFEWNADKTKAEVYAFLCNETGENINGNAGYVLTYNHLEGKMVVEKLYS